VEKQYINVGEP